MADEPNFFNDLQNNPELDAAMNEVENALMRFEQLLGRHMGNLSALQLIRRHQRGTSSIINSSLRRISDLFSGNGLPQGTVFNPKAQRFPRSSGQFMTDLGAAIQQITGRNL